MEKIDRYDNNISGVQMSYYLICDTKLWLFSHHISMEAYNENVMLGKIMHEERYKNERKEVVMENVKYDFVRTGKNLEVHEMKKSNKLENAHKIQLLYYLYRLKDKGVNAIGILDYPSINKHEKIILNSDSIEIIRTALISIRKILNGEVPQPHKKKYCGSCAYFNFCWC